MNNQLKLLIMKLNLKGTGMDAVSLTTLAIRTTVVPIMPLIGTTVVRISGVIGTTGKSISKC